MTDQIAVLLYAIWQYRWWFVAIFAAIWIWEHTRLRDIVINLLRPSDTE